MGRLTAFTIPGLVLIFWSSDHHPPHFHARKGRDWEIRVYIDTSTAKNGLDFDYKFPKNLSKNFRGISASEEANLLKKVINHKKELLTEWQNKVSTGEII